MADKSTFDCVGSNDVCNSLNHIHIWAERPYRFASFFGKQNKVIIFCHSTVKMREKDGKNHKKIYAHVLIADTHFTRTAIISHETNRKYDVCVCSRAKKD